MFIRTANRNVGYVIKVLGDRPIPSYSSSDAANFRDWLIDRGMGIKTVKRVFSSVRAIVNIAITEQGIDCVNGFAKTYFPAEEGVSKRQPIEPTDIRLTQKLCRDADDELRWLIKRGLLPRPETTRSTRSPKRRSFKANVVRATAGAGASTAAISALEQLKPIRTARGSERRTNELPTSVVALRRHQADSIDQNW